jgi:Uma2 family endonuclease
MGVSTSLTFEDFERLQDDGKKHELLKGEHITLPPLKSRHSNVQHSLLRVLQPYVDKNRLGDVRIEAGFKLSADTWLQPDVSFLRTAQLQRTPPDKYFEGAPALAIEVASESNTAAQLDLKMELCFAHGAEEVWIVYPKTRRVRAHFPDGHSETLASGLQSALFPAWSEPLSAIFPD